MSTLKATALVFCNAVLIIFVSVHGASLVQIGNEISVKDGTVTPTFLYQIKIKPFFPFPIGVIQCGPVKCPKGSDSCEVRETTSQSDKTKIEVAIKCGQNGKTKY